MADSVAPLGRDSSLGPLVELLRCLECKSPVIERAASLECTRCGAVYPVMGGTPRMLRRWAQRREQRLKDRTADSFAYEWRHFGAVREQWRKSFLDYLQPLPPEWFRDRLVLDVGAGSGRHSGQARACGARVVAVDVGDAIDVARRNLPPDVLTVQGDAEDLPFAEGAFDLVMSLGVLHHLPDTERALRSVARYARPGGRVQIYLYWWPPVSWHRRVLKLVERLRRLTVRLDHRLLHALCYPLAGVLFATCVLPYRLLRRSRRLSPLARHLPLKTYADYPFAVCVNDQFDRFSAPLERRFEADEVSRMMAAAGLEEVTVVAHHGWVAAGSRPPAAG